METAGLRPTLPRPQDGSGSIELKEFIVVLSRYTAARGPSWILIVLLLEFLST